MAFLNKNELIQTWNRVGFHAEKEHGQCFIINKTLCKQIISFLKLNQKIDSVIEVGAGFGAFSAMIAPRVRSYYLIEKNPTAAQFLEQEFQSKYNTSRIEARHINYLGKIPQKTRITIIQADILQIPFPSATKLVSNLPFSITYPFLIKLFRDWQFQSTILILQKDVIDTLTALPGESNYGTLSVLSNFFWKIHRLKNISSDCYFPNPDVKTILIQIKPKLTLKPNKLSNEQRRSFIFFIRTLFQYKTKYLINSTKLAIKNSQDFKNRYPKALKIIKASKYGHENTNKIPIIELFQLFKKILLISQT